MALVEQRPVRLSDISHHIFSTYISMRLWMGIIALAYPVILYIWGAYNGVPLAQSISHYYWNLTELQSPVRNLMVGGLFAIGFALYLYQGFTKAENYALNLAGIFAIGVALAPTEINCEPSCAKLTMHGFFAVSLFICLVYVTWFRSGDTLKYLPAADAPKYKRMYFIAGLIMFMSPLIAFILQALLQQSGKQIFFIEASGVWAFAAYWFIKTAEMKQSGAEEKAKSSA